MASEYKKATAYVKAVDKSKKTQKIKIKKKLARRTPAEKAKRMAKKLISKAVADAPKGKGRVPASTREAAAKVRAQITGKRQAIVSKKREFNQGANKVYKAEPARVLRRQTQDDMYEIDKMGLSFPSLHDEFKKTMSLLHGGDVGDSL